MPSSTESWGIEVGSNAIKAVHLQKTSDGVKLLDFEVLPFKKILTTPDLDLDEAIRVGLSQFKQKYEVGNAAVVVSVPGHMVFSRFAKLPPVEPKKVPDIVKFEAVQQIPFPIDEVEWDYQIFQHPDLPDVEVGIFAITKERVLPWLANFQAVGLPVHAITLSPIAAYNALAYDIGLADQPAGTVIMDVGTIATDLIVNDNGRLWMRTIPIGGNHFTHALEKGFKLSFTKAEKLKKEAQTSKYARQIFQAMRPIFVDLAQEVQKSLGFYQSQNREAELERIVGLGSTFRMSGLRTFMKQQLQINIDRINTFENLQIDDAKVTELADNSVVLTTAYGLAVQGLELETIDCNLLPVPVIRRQLWQSKTPWFIGAAAVVLLAGIFAYMMVFVAESTEMTRQAALTNIKKTISKGEQYAKSWSQTMNNDDPRREINNLLTMSDYRDLYPCVLEDVQVALQKVNTDSKFTQDVYVKATTAEERKQASEMNLLEVSAVTEIDRTERRLFFIDSVTIDYKNDASGEPTRNPRGPRRPTQAQAGDDQPKVLTLRIKGRTTWPFEGSDKGASVRVKDVFKPALEAQANQLTRPYKLIDCEIASIKPATKPVIRLPRPTNPLTPRTDQPAATEEVSYKQFLPQYVDTGDDTSKDTEFEIECQLQIKTLEEIQKDRLLAKQSMTPVAPPADATPAKPESTESSESSESSSSS